MGYAGWHGVQDHKHSLLAISYEPVEGTLACRFSSTEMPYVYAGVPERIYQILLRSPFAGSYLRKYVMRSYRCLNEVPPEFQEDKKVIAAKQGKQRQKRAEAAKEVKTIAYDLFGQIEGTNGPTSKRGKNSTKV